jgi:hypothetical protein
MGLLNLEFADAFPPEERRVPISASSWQMWDSAPVSPETRRVTPHTILTLARRRNSCICSAQRLVHPMHYSAL